VTAKPDFYKDASGQWRWRVVAANGEVVADSAEGYKRLSDCCDGYEIAHTADDA